MLSFFRFFFVLSFFHLFSPSLRSSLFLSLLSPPLSLSVCLCVFLPLCLSLVLCLSICLCLYVCLLKFACRKLSIYFLTCLPRVKLRTDRSKYLPKYMINVKCYTNMNLLCCYRNTPPIFQADLADGTYSYGLYFKNILWDRVYLKDTVYFIILLGRAYCVENTDVFGIRLGPTETESIRGLEAVLPQISPY